MQNICNENILPLLNCPGNKLFLWCWGFGRGVCIQGCGEVNPIVWYSTSWTACMVFSTNWFTANEHQPFLLIAPFSLSSSRQNKFEISPDDSLEVGNLNYSSLETKEHCKPHQLSLRMTQHLSSTYGLGARSINTFTDQASHTSLSLHWALIAFYCKPRL